MSRSTWVKRIGVTAAILGVSAGAFAVVKPDPKAKKDEITYEFGTVERRDVRSFVSATGIIQPWKTVDVKSNVAGRIDKLAVDLGDRVKAGQLIALIDPTDTQAASDQAQADLSSAQAKREQAQVSVVQQRLATKARIAGAERSIAAAKAKLAQAESSMKAQPNLTKSAINQAQAGLVTAQKSLSQAQQNKQLIQEQLTTLQEVTIPLNIKSVESTLEQNKANLATAESEYRRQRQLQGQGYVAKSDVEAAYAKLANWKASVKTAEQRMQTLQREHQLSVAELKAKLAAAQGAIEESQSRIEQAQATLQLAKDNSYQDEVRVQEREAAKAGVQQAQAELEAAKADLKQIAMKEKDVESAAAQIRRSQATVHQATVNLGYTKILAPREGVVIVKNVEEGTVVPSSRGSIGSTNALLQLGDTSRLWIICSVDETDIGQVSVGQKVTVKIDAYPSMLVDGKVVRIDPQAKIEQNVTNIPVTVEIALPDQRFKPGMNATCEFIVDEATHVLTVPNEALKESEGTYTVQQMVNGAPKDIEVEVGIAGPDVTEVRTGLKEGEQVITKTIKPEKAGTNNPFGSPFGGMGGRSGSGGRGGSGGSGGGGGRGGR